MSGRTLTNKAGAKAPPSGAIPMAKRVKTANRWREAYNPLRGLTLARAIALQEMYPRGEMAELQWLYSFVEEADPDLFALVERRTSALLELDWNIKIVAKDKRPSAFDQKLAEEQQAALREAYERIDNLEVAVEHLAMPTFRGFAHAELWRDNAGEVNHLEPVMQWNVVRDGLAGPWRYNPEARATTFAALSPEMDMDPEGFLVREVSRKVDRLGLLKFVRANLSEKDWDAFVEIYGIPGGVIIGPPNVPQEKEAEYEAAARDVAEGGSGYLPNGADYKTNDSPRSNHPFRDRLDHLSEKLVLAGTGGMLTMLTAATGIGKGPSEEHADVFQSIARGEARRVSGCFQRCLDRNTLRRNFRDKPALAYFELAANEERDVGDIVGHALTLHQAGFTQDAAELSERTGYKLTVSPVPVPVVKPDPEPPAPGNDDPKKEKEPAADPAKLGNRAPVPGVGNPVAKPVPPPGMTAADWETILGVRAQWLGPLLPELDRILALAGDGSLPGSALLDALENLANRLPEMRLDHEALGDRLEASLGAATVSSLRDTLATRRPSPDA